MEYYFNNDELYHYGRKGMRWGQNIFGKKRSSGVAGKATSKKAKAKKTEEKPKRKSARKMTDAELKEKIARFELEKNYHNLKKQSMSRGKSFVYDVLEASGKNIATQFATYVMGSSINAIAKAVGYKNSTQMIDNEDGSKSLVKVFEDIVNPRKGQKDK